MSSHKRNTYLEFGISDESDHDAGYDSDAAEVSKTGRASKKRKIAHNPSDDDSESEDAQRSASKGVVSAASDLEDEDEDEPGSQEDGQGAGYEDHFAATLSAGAREEKAKRDAAVSTKEDATKQTRRKRSKDKDKDVPPGVVYLSSVPPYLKPSALRNLLSQRGFTPITRLFLSPASKHKTSSKKNSRQLYTEGWIEFASKKTARRCAETLNAQVVGGKKSGFYHDDVWNMKYLKGMRWEELMAGVREEKREMEGRRDEERRVIMRETKRFVEGVEEGRRMQGMKKKKESKLHRPDQGAPAEEDVRRSWRQFEVQGKDQSNHQRKGVSSQHAVSDEVKQVLGKIF